MSDMRKPKSYETPTYLVGLADKLITRRGGRFGISVRDAAKEIGIGAATLSRVERGAAPDLASFRKMCLWLGESADGLLGIGR